jgi:hypothetical protein
MFFGTNPSPDQVEALVLRTYDDVVTAPPGIYIVVSGSAAFFPAIALATANDARIVGESYDDEGNKVVTLHVVTAPSKRAMDNFGAADDQRRTITIGREFFLTALKDYHDWPIKWWREAIQNSVDAGARHIIIEERENEDSTHTVVVDDDGGGMTEDVLINKFLVLGATTKVAESGAAGGFGKAKELLLLPWISWRVHTRDTVVDGAGIDYTVSKAEYKPGTRLEVIMPADKYTKAYQAIAFIEKCDLPDVHFLVNGNRQKANLRGKDIVDSVTGKIDVYFTPGKGKQPYLFVRTKGLFMFEQYVGEIPGYIVAELTAPSIDILTANRDGFRDYSVKNALDRLGMRIAKDNMSALRSKAGLIRQKFEGSGKFRAKKLAAGLLEQIGPTQDFKKLSEADSQQLVEVIDGYRERDTEAGRATQLPSSVTTEVLLDQKFTGPSHIEAALKQLVWEPDFFIINEIEGFRVPKKFFPATMTPRVLKLAKTWVELVRYVFMQLGSEQHFGVGWIFSETTAAACVTEANSNGDTEHWIMLNPFTNMRDGGIWHPTTDADLKWLYAAAVHESTHAVDGLSYHDESFAAALTMNIARTADGYRKIRAIVGGIKMRGSAEADVDDNDED